jgi:hypothetical protein
MLARLSSGFSYVLAVLFSSCGWMVARFIFMDIQIHVCSVLKSLMNAEILVIA